MPAPEAELLSTPAGPLQGAGPVRLQEQEHHLGGWRSRRGRRKALAAFGAFDVKRGLKGGSDEYVYWTDVLNVSYRMHHEYLSSCISWL